ncbi:hypothetical protein CO115_04060 [Candidatus Falkowbacteria bacterium CG_4_9_14_3_um_filter_36_9]|uniref:Uncharacterized protein n=1 Tax=Candidatus Falkowbacteria bacterium CG1_02_37_44 TaxID=1805146 RepID=A0A1J4T5A2_9BACT|nr:MAG: hypothetical protein AUJ27_03975 [Candidatus Falkowbacteria bacterium CG1_02_37_44]PJB18615.1 MAG: hypothetical protein CO115_04060 [Candidatus Falkowbacteria bacterium CG_4_9_14_3_um_filter_36_9]
MPEKYDFSKIEDRKKFEKLPKEEQDIVIGEAQEEAENLAKRVESGEAEKMVGNKEERKIVLTSEQEKAKQKIIDYLTWGNINHALEIKEEFSLQKEITQQAAEQGFIKYLLYGGNVDTALEIKRRFSLSEEFIVSPEVQRVARERFIKFLSIGDIDFGFKTRDIDSAFEIKDKFSLSEEFIQRAAGEEFIKCLSGNVDTALEIKKRFFLSEEFVQQAAKEAFIDDLSSGGGDIDFLFETKNKFSLPREFIASTEVQRAAKQGFTACLSIGSINSALEIKKRFSLSEEFVQQAAKPGYINCLSSGYINPAFIIRKEFSLPDEFITSLDVQRAAKQGFINCLSIGNIDSALEVRKEFNLSITSQEIFNQVPELQSLLFQIQKISLELFNQAQKSIEVVISLVAFKDKFKSDKFIREIQKNPFLFSAISENPRFSSKLLIKYSELDDLSQENIKFLFETKKEILKTNPELSPESLEFR